MRFFASSAVLATATLLGLAQPAAAFSLFSSVASVQVPVSGVESQAKLAAQLQSQGYSNVELASVAPTRENPHPELNPSLVNDPASPVRTGWNGVAQKDGETVQVYVTRS
ncbi:hypothetical protein [Acidocella aromatica]|uniref:PASTA domain-containing protein n=1 Tax=Acidocella aromatica TaxID=1303579 RepID=A0A840VFK3_9PROT|nr:hypothetical protein [Acidocella aromatica]MBB5374476.1 hypothetical protein [Acidocella aromatica]